MCIFFFSSRRRHTRWPRDWSSDVCSSDLGLNNDVAALVYPDRRGSGYGLTRFNEDMRLAFTRVEMEPDVHFLHRQGFVAKSTALDPKRLRELMSKAWRG